MSMASLKRRAFNQHLLDRIVEHLIFPFCVFSQDLCGFPPSLSCNLFTFNRL
jgi:hypothetical protein